MDNFLLQAITNELNRQLPQHYLRKLYQSGLTDLALDFRLRDGRWLMISTAPQRLALYLSERSPKQLDPPPRNDTAFIALCHKYLDNARLIAIEKLGYDRVITFQFSVSEGEQHLTRELIVALTGRSANVYLVEKGILLASLREHQKNAAGQPYIDPALPTDKLDPFEIQAQTLSDLTAAQQGNLATAAEQHLLGFTSVYAHELAQRAQVVEPALAIQTMLQELFNASPQAHVYSSQPLSQIQSNIGQTEFVSVVTPIALRTKPEQLPYVQGFASVNAAADASFSLLTERRAFIATQHELFALLNGKLKKLQQLQSNLTREQNSYARQEQYQRYGELLLANLQQVIALPQAFRVTDFYDAEQAQIEIPAAGKGTAKEAAEHYFKQARKARNGQQSIASRLPQIAADIVRLEQQLTTLRQITSKNKLDEFAIACGLSKSIPAKAANNQSNAAPKRKAPKLSGVRRYRATDGYEILVGRTNRDNDNLTLRIAKSYDLWFHAADYPGSHVILRNPARKPVPPQAINEAAQLAAKFSQARTEARIAVNYCEKKFVTKPKGFAPGQVRVASFKTILVEPKEAGERLLD